MFLASRAGAAIAAVVVVVALGAGVLVVSGLDDNVRVLGRDTTTTLPAQRDGGDRLEVLAVGNSVLAEIEPALDAALGSTGWIDVEDHTSPLNADVTRGDDPDYWIGEWERLVADNDPDVVVAMTSFSPTISACNATGEPCQDSTDVEGRFTALVDALASSGAAVVWVQYPPVQVTADEAFSNSIQERIDALGAIAAAAAETRDDLTVVDLTGPLSDDGDFTRWLADDNDRYRQVRKPDGVHLCPHGAAVAADTIAATIVADWNTGTTAPWVLDGWRTDPIFDRNEFGSERPCDDRPLDTPPAT